MSAILLSSWALENIQALAAPFRYEHGDEETVYIIVVLVGTFDSRCSAKFPSFSRFARDSCRNMPSTRRDFEVYISHVEVPAMNPHTREAERHRFIRFSFGKRRT